MPHEAIAPYNFVPISYVKEAEPPVTFARYHEGRHTGWFDLDITTLTPTYTRGAVGLAGFPAPVTQASDREEEDAPADFFNRGDDDRTPVMPGSSLRGMFRTVFEIISQSKMEFVSPRRLFYRFFAEVGYNRDLNDLYKETYKKKPLRGGILREDGEHWVLEVSAATDQGFVLIAVDDVLRRQREEYNQTLPVLVRWGSDRHKTIGAPFAGIVKHNGTEAHLVIPGPGVGSATAKTARKYYQAILKPGDDCIRIQISRDVIADYYARREMAFGRSANTPAYGREMAARGVEQQRRSPRLLCNGEPAFVLLSEDGMRVVSVGANMMMHLRYEHSIADVVERSHQRSGKEPIPDIDMASRVFGRVGGQETIRGRVFVEDAVCRTDRPYLGSSETDSVLIPQTLATPKPTAIQMYLEQNDNSLQHWDSTDSKVRGFKLYWHRPLKAAYAALGQNGTVDSQHTRIMPVRKHVKFTGRVRFENLTDAELGGLYASLQLPTNMAHRFGMGKSLGLGSVRVEVKQTTLLDMAARYREPWSGDGNVAGEIARSERDAMLRAAYVAFVSHVHPGGTSLWRSRRMQHLAALLFSEPVLSSNVTQQISIIGDDKEQWKERYRLPEALELRPIEPLKIMDVVPTEVAAVAPNVHQPDVQLGERAIFRQGDKIKGRILNITSGMYGDVEVLIGGRSVAVIKNVAGLYGCKVGEEPKFKVVKVGGDGVIKELARG